MFKKLVFVTGISLLLGCSSLSTKADLSNSIAKVISHNNYTEVIGLPLTPDYSGKLLSAKLTLTANVAKKEGRHPNSRIFLDVSFLDNSQRFYFVELANKRLVMKEYKVSTRICSSTCNIGQYFEFPVDNQILKKSVKTGMKLKIIPKSGSGFVTLEIPAGYIKSIIDNPEVNQESTATALNAKKMEADPVLNSQKLFNKATPAEKKQFTQWAFKNTKAVKSKLKTKSKVFSMLIYWYEKANENERAEILTWIIAQ